MRTTLSIEDGLLEEAKCQASKRKTTLGAVVNEALRRGLLRNQGGLAESVARPLKTFKGTGLQAGVDLYNSPALMDLMQER